MPNSIEGAAREADDQTPHAFEYGHGRMPLFMKLAWLCFLAFGAWYLTSFVLEALGRELAAH